MYILICVCIFCIYVFFLELIMIPIYRLFAWGLLYKNKSAITPTLWAKKYVISNFDLHLPSKRCTHLTTLHFLHSFCTTQILVCLVALFLFHSIYFVHGKQKLIVYIRLYDLITFSWSYILGKLTDRTTQYLFLGDTYFELHLIHT